MDETDQGNNSRGRGYYSEIITGTPEHPVKPEINLLTTAPRRTKLSWQIFTPPHIAKIKEFPTKKVHNVLGAAKRWMNFPEDKSIIFPAETFAPKIQKEHNVEPGNLPRNVEIERKRRLYRNLKVEDALEKLGISPRDILPPAVISSFYSDEEKYGLHSNVSYLPLEFFDDDDFDCRTPTDWMNLGFIEGVQHPLPAVVYVEKAIVEKEKFRMSKISPDKVFEWRNAAVVEFDYEKSFWTIITLDGHKRTYLLPRIYVRFYAEDPEVFAKRIACAVKNRRQTEACIRYNFYLDCIPLDDTPSFNEDTEQSIIVSAIRNGSQRYSSKNFNDIINEIHLDYRRVMCDLMWRRILEERCDGFQFIAWRPTNNTPTIPKTAKIHTGMINFPEIRSYFHWVTLYVLPEVYESMTCINGECLKVSEDMNLFTSNYGKSMSLAEFETEQNQMTITMIKYLKVSWLEKITQSVRMCLRDVGKGSFNLEQKNHHVYDVMKLKRFMDLTVLLMQNALRNLVNNSISLYVNVLETPALCVLDVDEYFYWMGNLTDTEFQPAAYPVFSLDLMMNDKGTYYSTNPDSFEETIVSLYDNALTMCHQIRQVHPFLLTSLKFPKDLYLSSVGLQEESVCDIRERLRVAYKKSVIPLKAYARRYEQYLPLFLLDVSKYVQEFKEADHTSMEIKEEISLQLDMKGTLESTLPRRIHIGPYDINVEPLKLLLMEKRRECSTRLLDMYIERLRSQTDEIFSEYESIMAKLKEPARTIEEVFEQKEWMETIPLSVKSFDDSMEKLKMEYEMVDHFRRNLSDDDFSAKWHTLACPREIQLEVVRTEERHVEEQENFYKQQIQDEAALMGKVDTLVGNVANVSLQTDIGKVQETAIDVKRIWKIMQECQEQALLLNSRQKLFGMAIVPFQDLARLMKEFEPYKNLWITASDWFKSYELWMDNPLLNIDGEEIENKVTEMHKAINRCAKNFEDIPEVAGIAVMVREQIESFKPYVNMIQALRNPGVKARHYEEISEQTSIQMALTPTLTFKHLTVLGIMEFEGVVQKVADAAAKEHLIEETLDKMIDEWQAIEMELVSYKNTGTYVAKVSEETMILLDEHVLKTQQLVYSPFKAAFEEKIDQWEKKLTLMQEVIALWMQAQTQWMYLEPIFSSEDISRQLPVETRKFGIVDRTWRRIMNNAQENPNMIRNLPDRNLLESLKECLNLLGFVQKGLSDYLETKRIAFPRFYFLSDDELLDIVAQTKNVQAVQPHLKKCFENMKELRFEADLKITRMYSAEYEEVVLRPAIYPQGNVENWLGQVESAMRNTLREIVREAVEVVENTPRKQWVYMWPGQIVISAGQTYWTAHVEHAIATNTLPEFYEVMLSHMNDLRELVRGKQTEIQRLMLEAVITIEVHARDVLYKLIQEEVVNVNDFDWISQLRYYWVEENDLKIRAVNAEFPYQYEYLGNNGRLVITPLTDRCYLTLTGALHLKFGGAPSGPAGTGKTETTKDLAKAFAVQCVVFNCSDQLDFLSMGKFFKGLASAGAWACFDEFNRIDVEVLSVIAQQIMTIQKAQQIGAEVFLFEGMELSLRPSCAVFITMNPGYAGRTELPDNLKALFRPVAMMVPNYALIAEISLFSYGFFDAKNLAGKITTTFKLSSEQLSTQDHYDFGMRAVKTVIAAAGNLKREQKDLEDQQIVLRALRDVNVPKFLKDDLKLFNGIVSDLFPRLTEKPVDYGILEASIRTSIRKMNLADVDEFVKKVIQLYETTVVRHGLMLVGPTGSGKTKCYEVLKDACTSLKGQLQPSGKPFTTVHTYVLNPKAITMGQLYGEYNLETHEWTDGILSTLIRDGSSAGDMDKRWYVFDGPVDAVWIENLNTVLDDNKKLCLTSGEIIKLTSTQTMMFEVADLSVASPATVSRCGMVYLEPEGLGIEPFIDCWIQTLPDSMSSHREEIGKLTYQLLPPALQLLRRQLREIVNTVDAGMVKSYINLMNFRIGPMAGREGKSPPSFVFQRTIPDLLSPWAALSLVWSLGASCDNEGRHVFSEWLKNLQKKEHHQLPFPSDGLVYDYRLHDGGFTDPIENQEPIPPRWYKWMDDVPTVNITPDTKFADIEVPTVDNVRNAILIGDLLLNETNILCVGPTGSGKTITVSAKLSRNLPKKYICDFMTFSARTTANQIQVTINPFKFQFSPTEDIFDGKLDKRRRGTYGPPMLKKQIFFIDDLNMPALETYGAQPPLELIRQFMDFAGWYDRKEIGSFKLIEDVNFVSAMAPPGGGRNPITLRLLRHFHFLAFPEMEDDAKTKIFGTILGSWLSRTPTLGNLVDVVVLVTLNVFKIICKDLLPTPEKSHYTFNLRDLSRVFQGLLMAEPGSMQSREELFLLWYHENRRVFSDRLINDQDRKWYDQLLRKTLKDDLQCDANKVVGKGTLFFGDFCESQKQYQQIADVEKMERALLEQLADYNSSSTFPMKIVLFEDAMDHICRISRILRQPRGNALLLGMGGSGRQSLTKLATHIQEYNCFQIEVTKSYTYHDWQDNIKSVMLKAGLQNQPIVFLYSDTQIKWDSMLEDLNNILNNGDVPNIYKPDEMEKIFETMRGPVQEAGLPINPSNLFSTYLKIVRNNVHIVVTMSPLGEIFRARIRQFPALVNCCTIDWFCPWPDTALQSVAVQFLAGIQDESITESVLRSIVITCQYMHTSTIEASSRLKEELDHHNYVTPTAYLELLSSYGGLLTRRKDELQSSINRLSTGLHKLANTELEVKEMQILLRDMKPALEEASVKTAEMIERIKRDTIEAEKTREEAIKQEAAATKLKKENQMIKDEAEADLSVAKPMLDAAEMSLKALNKSDITEVKAMKRPPVGVTLVIEAMCIVNDVKPNKLPGKMPGEKILDYWTPGSHMLADAGHFLYTMENFDKSKINEEMINKLKDYIENPNFEPSQIIHVSKACHSLCLWVHAMYNYYFVNKKVEPKMKALAEAEIVLAETEKAVAAANERLREVQKGIESLQNQLQKQQEQQSELEKQKQLCEDRMNRAVKLTVGLADEQKRWIISVAEMKESLKNAVGDILLASGAMAYLTPLPVAYRENLLSSWYEILSEGVPHTADCKPVSTLGDPVEIRKWHIDGLPRDTLSVENAVLVAHSKRWPLFIDPQGQANNWIRRMKKATGLSIVKMTDRDMLRVIENCVRFGTTCLIENIATELEPSLDSILMRSVFRQGLQWSIKIGDNIVPYHSDFRLFMTTRLANPRYPPEVATKVLLVNFAVTVTGLIDQMLSLVTIQERPDLEETRNALIISNAEMKRDLKEIEERILYRLSVSEGSAVDDIDLVVTLEASKTKSEEIKSKVESAEVTQADIDKTRSLYIPVANRAQILFFCVGDLRNIDPMYQYSLEWFVTIFNNSILNAEKSEKEDTEKRIENINKHFTFSLYSNVCRSLFEKHKLQFGFLLCARIRMNQKIIDPREWRFFLSSATPSRESPNPAPDWISSRCWREIRALEILPTFENFVASFRQSLRQFKNVFDIQEAHLAPLPEPWETKLDGFKKMLVLKSLRPDKVMNAIQAYVAKHLGQEFVEPETTDLSTLYKESSNVTPLVFVLSTGTDPAADLYKFADKLKMSKKFLTISLGQGQGPRATAMIKQSMELGNWVFFQNCHLAPSWMPNLEFLVEGLSSENTHKDFRLWLTSLPSPDFPVSILQNSSKMTMEPPRGMKANMLRAYSNQVTEMKDFLQSENSVVQPLKWLLFALCMFHSVLLERRKFGPLGFNIPYEFTDGDLTICVSQLQMFLTEYETLPFKVLIYTVGHINYGGRITDDWDRRTVLTILKDYYNPKVLADDYQFDEQGFYYQLKSGASLQDYIHYIKSLPLNDDPLIFGLHQNADISSAQAETFACLDTLLALQPKEIGTAEENAEQVTIRLANEMLIAVPQRFDLQNIQQKYPILYEESFNTVLFQEAKRYNDLLTIVKWTLSELLRALKGFVVLSEKLEAIAESLFKNKIPKIWQDKGYPSLKPLGAWYIDLQERINFIKNWEEEGIPSAFWISGFYFPQAFLTGTLQNFARKHVVSIDTINFRYKVLSSKPKERPKDGCVVYGLFLEGCRWGGNYLEESHPKELFTEMNPILLLPEVDHKVPAKGIYICPVYKTIERAGTLSTTGHSTNFVLAMEIPSQKTQNHWTKRSVALICALNY